MRIHKLKPRNGVQPIVSFDVITLAMDDLRSVYLDEHHSEYDKITVEVDKIRRDALADREAWSDVDAAELLAQVLGAIEGAEDIEALRESEVYQAAHDKAQPLTAIMGRQGTRFLLMKRNNDMKRHTAAMRMWVVACLGHLEGDLAKYFGDASAEWPRIGGNAERNAIAVRKRLELLYQLDEQDAPALCELADEHVRERAGLTEEQEGN
jgi:hypothetical protein